MQTFIPSKLIKAVDNNGSGNDAGNGTGCGGSGSSGGGSDSGVILNSQSQLHVNVNGHHENDDNNHTMMGNGAVQDLGALGQNNINGIINNHHKMMVMIKP
ncbi:hypothetical protein RIR_jg5933.t1 [Rhizophagus irregularis DAOM 181602=DAOM 197198]|nr:hypothetical protein RIR_jg5933.t1 [Rhizophagus irregularis DAOM 181602=DAOM 197198]